ncbi:WD40-repeat-containing domain protein [Chiua virens]|nr:WD40-repeat-containing domain protein [Chiua virens]
MLTTPQDDGILLDTGSGSIVSAAVFSPDGKHLFSGSSDGVRRFQLADKLVKATQMGMEVGAISISRVGPRIVCGMISGVTVWDWELQEMVCYAESGNSVPTVDVSPNASRFVTGTYEMTASVWDIATGERQLGSLKFSDTVNGVRFSPNGDRIAISELGGPITILDSHTGDRLVTIDTNTTESSPCTPIAWSNDAQRLFATCKDHKVKSFDTSTGSLLAESQVIDGFRGGLKSIAIAPNGRFIAAQTDTSVSFLDVFTLLHVRPVLRQDNWVRSIAFSLDGTYLAIGQGATVVVRNLSTILPDIISGMSTVEEGECVGQQTASDENKSRDFDVPSSHHNSRPDTDPSLLEHEIPSRGTPQAFDYSQPPSPISSVRPRMDELLPVEISHAISSSSHSQQATSPPEPHLESHPEGISSSKVRQMIQRWLQKGTGENVDDRVGQPSAANLNPLRPTMVSKREPRTHVEPIGEPQVNWLTYYFRGLPRQEPPVPTPILYVPPSDHTHAGTDPAVQNKAVLLQPVTNPPQVSHGGIIVIPETIQTRPDRMRVIFSLPTWLICFRPCSVDNTD